MGIKQILPALSASILVSVGGAALPGLCSNVDVAARAGGQPVLIAQTPGTTTYYGGSGNSFGPVTSFGNPAFPGGSYAPPGFGSQSNFGFGSAGFGWSSNSPGYNPTSYSGFGYPPRAGYTFRIRSGWRGPNYTNPDLPVGARALKKATVWEAPSAGDRQLKQAIQASEIDNGPDDPATVHLIVEAVKYYVKTKQFEKAEPLLKRLNRLGFSNSETAMLQSAVSAGLRPSDPRYRAFLPSSRDLSSRQPVQIQPPSSLDQAFPRLK